MPGKISTNQLLNMMSERTYDVYCQLHRTLKQWLREHNEVSQDLELRRHYIYVMEFAEKVEGILHLLSSNDDEAKAKFIISKSKGVDDLEGRIIKFNRRNETGPYSCGS